MDLILKLGEKEQTIEEETRAVALCQEADLAYRAGKIDEAAAMLEQALEMAPEIAEGHVLLGLCCLKQKKYRTAVKRALSAIILDPENQKARQLLKHAEEARVGKVIAEVFRQTEPPAAWPNVSLCMIVKNEEANLAACLESAGDFAFEKIVVDTGSTDRTVEIARSCGAQVEHFEWINDFAAARSHSIKNANGDWIFILDGDERIDALDLVRLKWAACGNDADIIFCQTVDRGQEGETTEENHYQTMRMFRNRKGLDFENALHHSIMPAAKKLGLTASHTNICIQHYGYNLDPVEKQKKLERNIKVLDGAIANDPKDYFSRLIRAIHIFGKDDKIEDIAREFEEVLPNLPEDFSPVRTLGDIYLDLINFYIEKGDQNHLAWIVEQALADFPFNDDILVIIADVVLNLFGNALVAMGILTLAFELVREDYPEIQLKRHKLEPGFVQKLLAKSNLFLGKMDEAKEAILTGKILAPICIPGDEKALRLAAREKRELGAWAESADLLMVAVLCGQLMENDWKDLAGLEFKAGRLRAAQFYLKHALVQDPNDSGAWTLAAILAVQQENFEGAVEYFVRSVLANPGDQRAMDNLAEAAGSMELTPVGIILLQGRRWVDQRDYPLAASAFELATRMEPENPEANRLKGLINDIQGRLN